MMDLQEINNIKKGLKEVNDAGIQVVMITGDNKDTATAIGEEIGLVNSKDDLILSSDEFNRLDDEKIKSILCKKCQREF